MTMSSTLWTPPADGATEATVPKAPATVARRNDTKNRQLMLSNERPRLLLAKQNHAGFGTTADSWNGSQTVSFRMRATTFQFSCARPWRTTTASECSATVGQ